MKIIAEVDGLVIQLEGMEKIWALKSRLEVPIEEIISIDYSPERPPQNFAWPFIKFPGSVIPQILMAGRFVKPGERDFWFLRVKHSGILSIEMRPGGYSYDRILLSSDPETAQQIANWWAKTRVK